MDYKKEIQNLVNTLDLREKATRAAFEHSDGLGHRRYLDGKLRTITETIELIKSTFGISPSNT